MDVIRGPQALSGPLAASVLAIGNFDGVHRGHQAVLEAALGAAREAGSAAGVMVFEPHPRQYFKPEEPLFRLTPLDLKLKLFELLGLDFAVVLDFDKSLAGREPEDFVKEILVAGLGVRHVVTGYDFHFGKNRRGTPDFLRAMGREIGFGVTIVEEVGGGGDSFSSSQARALLRAGEVRAAAEILGYWWRVLGRVEAGAARGTGLGYPTANLTPPANFDLAHGIYAVRTMVPQGRFGGAAYVGRQPTYDGKETVIEAFLFDFEGDLYGRRLVVELWERLRDEAVFESEAALVAQIAEDVEATRRARRPVPGR